MKICFLAPSIYPLFAETRVADTAGGAELQQKFIGKGLRERGYEVVYVSKDYGQADVLDINGVRILKSYKPGAGIYGLRVFYPLLYRIWKALTMADADVYYVRCASYLVGIAAFYSRLHKKKFIFAGAHENDFTPARFMVGGALEKLLYVYGLENADLILVQSYQQQQLLREHFGLEGKVVRNFSPSTALVVPCSQREFILWVSTIRAWKRPFHFLRLAEQFPHEKFIMIGGPAKNDKNLYSQIEDAARKIPNLQFLGHQPFEKTEGYFDKAKVFINTSEFEGFPNTFLQAWSRGIPVISYFDPDGIAERNNLGLIARSEEELKTCVRTILNSPRYDPNSISAYFRNNHSEGVIDSYCYLLDNLFRS